MGFIFRTPVVDSVYRIGSEKCYVQSSRKTHIERKQSHCLKYFLEKQKLYCFSKEFFWAI